MAYDGRLKKMLLFSGVRGDDSCQFASTWIMQDSWAWNGTNWARLRPTSLPPGRRFGALAYDDARQVTLLFGGGAPDSDPLRLDTWVWDGHNWSEKHPLAPPQSQGLITYDAASASVLLLNDSTYSWDGTNWVDLHPAHLPSEGNPAFMAYDAARRTPVVLTIDAQRATTTWSWSGLDWQRQHPAHQPSGATTASGAYDGQRGVVLAFVGDETWAWNGSDWTRQHPVRSPRPRYFASMAYDPDIGKVVLFGGKSLGLVNGYAEQVNNELWAWDGTNWTRLA